MNAQAAQDPPGILFPETVEDHGGHAGLANHGQDPLQPCQQEEPGRGALQGCGSSGQLGGICPGGGCLRSQSIEAAALQQKQIYQVIDVGQPDEQNRLYSTVAQACGQGAGKGQIFSQQPRTGAAACQLEKPRGQGKPQGIEKQMLLRPTQESGI